MLDVEPVKKILKKVKPFDAEDKANGLTFDEIYDIVKDKYKDVAEKIDNEDKLKTDLHFSLIETPDIVYLGSDCWALTENFTPIQLDDIKAKVLSLVDFTKKNK